MGDKNLVICDYELGYANALAENILEREELGVKVYIFSSTEKIMHFLENNKIHILVMDESFYEESVPYPQAEVYFTLVQKNGDFTEERIKQIYKYQNSNKIIQDIFETYVARTNETVLKGHTHNQTRLEAVYSPVRGIGKTKFAIAWGKELARNHKVLYLNMEEYPGFEMNGPDETKMNLGDLLYFMKQKTGDFGLRVQAAVQKIGNMDYVPPIYLASDVKEVSEDEWIEFLEKVIAIGLYEHIILDLGECVQGLFSILMSCDCIYTPTAEGESERQKIFRYEQCLERMGLEKILRITQQFVLPDNVEGYVKQRMKEVK